MDDDFAEGDIDAGDQNMNFDDGEDMIFNEEEDEIDAEAEDDDKDFLKEISKPTAAKKVA